MNKSTVKKSDFNIQDYVDKHYIEKRNGKTINRFMFTDKRIDDLPFIEEGIIDFKDSQTDKNLFIKANLVIRISKTTKVFYPQFNGKMGKKLGNWMKRPKSGGHIPKGLLTTTMAKELFKERYEDQEALDDRVSYMKRKTILDYIENHYTEDRKDTPLDSGKCTPLSTKTKKVLLADFRPWLDFKLEDVNSGWAKEFKAHWSRKRRLEIDSETGEKKEISVSTGSMRKSFVIFKAMIGICKTLGYIAKNPLMNQGHLFPENPIKEKNHFIIDRGEVVKFIFSEEFEKYYPHTYTANFEGKIIVASVVLTGCRPIEIRSNYKNNFRINDRLINIESGLQKKTSHGRNTAIENDLYWQMVQLFIEKYYINNVDGRMFYSHNSSSGYVSETKYRYHWQAVKEKFGLDKNDLLYHNRHAMATVAAHEIGPEKAASMLGHSESIANKNYINTVSPKVRDVMRKIQNSDNTEQLREAHIESNSIERTDKIIELKAMPDSIRHLYEVFAGVREIPATDQLYYSDWLDFSAKIQQRINKSKLDEAAEDWYELIC